jgi:lactate dehydrogenase-like 2-hydroxyacid dehydrogenase
MTQPDILVFSPSQSPAVMQQLETHFVCHHLWQLPAPEQEALVAQVGSRIRAVLTVGPLGLDAAMVERLPQLEIVAINSVGIDRVDLDCLRRRGIRATNTPGVLTDDVADLGVLLVLAAARSLVRLDRHVRDGAWEDGAQPILGRSVKGKVAGIVGFGRIGQALALRLRALGMELRYFQPRPLAQTEVPRAASLLELARHSDYLVLCAPASEETRGMVDAAVLSALGPQGTLVNIARGSLVDEAALVHALQTGELGGAALDVFAHEPAVPVALRALDNVILSPHAGSLTHETRHAMGQLALDNLLAHFQGRPLPTPVC